MIGDYNWDEILGSLKKFASVEDISNIIILGEEGGIRRIDISGEELE